MNSKSYIIYKPVLSHLRTAYADNVALPAFARRDAVRRAAVDRYLLPAAPQPQSLLL